MYAMQGCSMAKVKFSHDVEPEAREMFNGIVADLRSKKYEVLETMIMAFKALPEDVQRRLISAKPETREPALRTLAAITMPPGSGQSDQDDHRKGRRKSG